MAEAQALGGMGFYEMGASISSLSGGAEIHLNKMNFLDFEKNALEAGGRYLRDGFSTAEKVLP